MKSTYLLSLLVICLYLISCKNETIVLSPKKEADHKHLGFGVWAQLDGAYTKSNEFDGYKGPGSSISVEIENLSSKEMRRRYEPFVLKRKGMVIIEFAEVQYGERDSTFFVVIEDKRLNMYKYNLSIKTKEGVTNVKAFCYKNQASYCYQSLKKSLLSTVIDLETKIREEGFLITGTDWLGTSTYTKDGKFPTESPDQAIFKIGNYKSVRNSQDKGNILELIFDITGEKDVEIRKEELLNGYYQYAISSGNGLHAYAVLIYDDKREGKYIICQGNLKENINDCRKFFLKNNIREE